MGKRGQVKIGDCNFFYGKANENNQLGRGIFFCAPQNSISSKVSRVC